jgi:hypothetical protein
MSLTDELARWKELLAELGPLRMDCSTCRHGFLSRPACAMPEPCRRGHTLAQGLAPGRGWWPPQHSPEWELHPHRAHHEDLWEPRDPSPTPLDRP